MMIKYSFIVFLGLFFVSISPIGSFAESWDWPQWRGPNGNGVSAEKGWISTWPKEGPKVLWKKSLGMGYSTVTVSNGRVYTMGNSKKMDTVFCLDENTGNEIWKYSYQCAERSWPGTRIAPTVDGDRVYTLSQEGNLFCFDAVSGKVIWSKDLKNEMKAKIPEHGMTCHPLIVGNMMILEVGAEGGSVVAFDKKNGNVIWKSGNDGVGYSTPSVYKVGGKDYLVVFTGDSVLGMNIPDGKILWDYNWETEYDCNIATPLVSGNKIFISAGYGMGCALLQINEDNKPIELWKNKEMANHFNSSVLWNGYLYGFHGAPNNNNDKGELRCMDFNTGNVKWAQKDLGKSSLMLADGKLIVLSEKGELVIADASPNGFKELARAKVIDGTCWTVPVLSNGKIYCRSHEGELVCVDVKSL